MSRPHGWQAVWSRLRYHSAEKADMKRQRRRGERQQVARWLRGDTEAEPDPRTRLDDWDAA